jgi:hypothetical protein
MNQTSVNTSANDWRRILLQGDEDVITDSMWRFVPGTSFKVFVYSAFFDNRTGDSFIRVLGRLPTKIYVNGKKSHIPPPFKCQFLYKDEGEDELSTNHAESTPAVNVSHLISRHWIKLQTIEGMNPEYIEIAFVCPRALTTTDKAGLPYAVSVYGENITVEELETFRGNILLVNVIRSITQPRKSQIVMCPQKSMHGVYSNVAQLIEFIEIHTLMGISHFHLYPFTYTPQIECVMRYYREIGLLTIHNYEEPMLNKDMDDGLPMTDCLFRSMANATEYVAA